VPYSESDGKPGKRGSPGPNRQLGDFQLIEAKQNPEGDSGDVGATCSGASEGEADGPLNLHEFVESIVPQEAVGCDDDSGPQGNTMVCPCVPVILHCVGILSSWISHHWAWGLLFQWLDVL
jgi:hypothetical protein